MSTSETEVEGSIIHIVHDDGDTRTPLALTTTDDLGELTTEEESETANLTRERRTRRYRTSNEPTLEVGSLLAANLDALEMLGWVDTDGRLTEGTPDRRQTAGMIRLEYYKDETASEPELVNAIQDVELVNITIDPSSTPPIATWTWWINGRIWFGGLQDLTVESGETYTVESDTEETYLTTEIEEGGTLTQESGSTLNTMGY